MPTDNPTSRERAEQFMSEGGRVPDRAADELDEAAERLERTSWERFESAPGDTASSIHAETEEQGAITAFLGRQLNDRPLPTLLAAVAAGWLVGKLLR